MKPNDVLTDGFPGNLRPKPPENEKRLGLAIRTSIEHGITGSVVDELIFRASEVQLAAASEEVASPSQTFVSAESVVNSGPSLAAASRTGPAERATLRLSARARRGLSM
jgi:hypothetical protein